MSDTHQEDLTMMRLEGEFFRELQRSGLSAAGAMNVLTLLAGRIARDQLRAERYQQTVEPEVGGAGVPWPENRILQPDPVPEMYPNAEALGWQIGRKKPRP
jgi:hypothetical protein